MSFSQRFYNGLGLLKATLAVIRANPRLMLFPAASAALTLFMSALVLAPIALRPTGHSLREGAHWEQVSRQFFAVSAPDEYDQLRGRKQHVEVTGQAIAFFAIFYLLSMFLATFFNVGFAHEIFDALDGKNVSVAEGLQFAGTKIKMILLWTLFAGLVGVLIKGLEEKVGFVGKLILRFIGLAWAVASVFVIPVMVMEEHSNNPIDVVKQSAGVIRKAWGEAIAGYAGLQIGGWVALLASFALLGGGAIFGFTLGSWMPFLAGLGLWFAFLFAFSYTMGVVNQVYLCVLYRYAATGVVPQGFTQEQLSLAWTPKK